MLKSNTEIHIYVILMNRPGSAKKNFIFKASPLPGIPTWHVCSLRVLMIYISFRKYSGYKIIVSRSRMSIKYFRMKFNLIVALRYEILNTHIVTLCYESVDFFDKV